MEQTAQFAFSGSIMLADYLPHGNLVAADVVADTLIALACFCIPGLFLSFVKRRRDIQFNGIFVAFGLLMLAFGVTHVMDVVTLWTPLHGLAAFFKALTALASVAAALITQQKGKELLLENTLSLLTHRDKQLAMLLGEGGIGDFTWNIQRDELIAHRNVWEICGRPEERHRHLTAKTGRRGRPGVRTVAKPTNGPYAPVGLVHRP
jgi:hypothetical protein